MIKLILVICFSLYYTIRAQNVNLGELLHNSSTDYELKGISSKTGEHHYQYKKKITKMMFGYTVDNLVVTTKNKKVVSYIFILNPKVNEYGIKDDLVLQVENKIGQN